MKSKNIINIFYFLTILNYVLYNKLNCLITLIGLHIIFYVAFKNDTKSKLLSIIGSMFLFCGQLKEDFAAGPSTGDFDARSSSPPTMTPATPPPPATITAHSATPPPPAQVCTENQIKTCKGYGAVCQEPIGCVLPKKTVDYYDRGFRGSGVIRPNLYNKRVHMINLLNKYD